MTYEEAIKRIKEFGLYHAIGDLPHSALTVEAFQMAIEALEKQAYLERNLYDDIFMKGYYPTDKPEELSNYHLFVPYKVVEQFILKGRTK